MNSDAYFEIGTTHIVCQDYALAGQYQDMHYAILSDGCSSAKYSEIGSQILCHVTQYFLHLYYDLFASKTDHQSLERLLGNSILTRADEIRKLYTLNPECLQAILLIAIHIKGMVHVFGWGDGVIITKTKNSTRIFEIDYPETNAPFYLGTSLDIYIKTFGPKASVRHRVQYVGEESQIFETTLPVYKMVSMEADLVGASQIHETDNVDTSIILCSDGLTQYMDQDSKPIPVTTIVQELIDYPNTKGAFIQRTMNFMKKELIKKKWSHLDDISVAGISYI